MRTTRRCIEFLIVRIELSARNPPYEFGAERSSAHAHVFSAGFVRGYTHTTTQTPHGSAPDMTGKNIANQ
jgi:hypothetical protein